MHEFLKDLYNVLQNFGYKVDLASNVEVKGSTIRKIPLALIVEATILEFDVHADFCV